MSESRCYFYPDSSTLFDVSSGIYTYNINKDALSLVRRFSKQEIRVLTCLMAHEGQVVTRDILSTEVWAGRVVSINSINVAISRLRYALKCIDPLGCCLKTVRNSGFVFSIHHSGAIPVISQDFLLANLRWAEKGCERKAITLPTSLAPVAASHTMHSLGGA